MRGGAPGSGTARWLGASSGIVCVRREPGSPRTGKVAVLDGLALRPCNKGASAFGLPLRKAYLPSKRGTRYAFVGTGRVLIRLCVPGTHGRGSEGASAQCSGSPSGSPARVAGCDISARYLKANRVAAALAVESRNLACVSRAQAGPFAARIPCNKGVSAMGRGEEIRPCCARRRLATATRADWSADRK